METILTGITPSGVPHLGNYLGAIKPAIANSKKQNLKSLYFIADYHSLVKLWDAKLRKDYIYEVAATWLALGLDPELSIFYRQSDIPEILELNWILSTVAAKGLLNRAHAYKDQVSKNLQAEEDSDAGINMGLFCYPVLMSADILAFNADLVPVGKDQVQHIEIARDIALRFNHVYKECFHTPSAVVSQDIPTLPGLDGRKMSKNYNNTIPIFLPSKQLRKTIMKIKTNSQLPHEPKDPDACNIFKLYQSFASKEQIAELKSQYETGIGWGDAKQALFELLDAELAGYRDVYNSLITDHKKLDVLLAKGAEKARSIASDILSNVKKAAGL